MEYGVKRQSVFSGRRGPFREGRGIPVGLWNGEWYSGYIPRPQVCTDVCRSGIPLIINPKCNYNAPNNLLFPGVLCDDLEMIAVYAGTLFCSCLLPFSGCISLQPTLRIQPLPPVTPDTTWLQTIALPRHR